jgi:hypothetical protein
MPIQSGADMNSVEGSAHPMKPANDPSLKEGLTDQARQAGAALAETAQRAGDQVREAAASLGSEAQQRFQGYMDQKVVAGADLAGRIAGAINAAADELGRTSPALGSAVRNAGERVQDLSQRFRDKTADEIIVDTWDFVRHTGTRVRRCHGIGICGLPRSERRRDSRRFARASFGRLRRLAGTPV